MIGDDLADQSVHRCDKPGDEALERAKRAYAHGVTVTRDSGDDGAVGATWTIDAYNSLFLILALALHGRPLAFLRACRAGIDSAWGIVRALRGQGLEDAGLPP